MEFVTKYNNNYRISNLTGIVGCFNTTLTNIFVKIIPLSSVLTFCISVILLTSNCICNNTKVIAKNYCITKYTYKLYQHIEDGNK